MRLHLGCGTNYKEGWVNIDIDPDVKADWYGDANNMPFDNNTFTDIYSHHALEHFECLPTIVAEMVRVSKNDARWEIEVPYWTWGQNQGNPFHKIMFHEKTFDFFGKIYKRGYKGDFSLDVEQITYHWNEKLYGQHPDHAWMYLKERHINVVNSITFEIRLRK